MKKEFSIYLDLVRLVAALLVVVYHSNVRAIISAPLPFSQHGHAAVIVFFVLSGYVIAYISAGRESAPLDYWASRLSRFYSLVIPAVLMCPLLDLAGEALAPRFYEGKTTHDLAWLRMVTSLAYLNEIWTLSIMSFSNVPFWSLCYEMWYYALFAVVAFTRGSARRWLAAAVLLFVGPKILLLAPIWWLGVALYRWRPLAALRRWQGYALFLGSMLLYGLFQHYGMTEYGSRLALQLVGPHWHHELAFSKYFIMDYPLALIVACNFVGFRTIAADFRAPLLACERPIRWLSAYTFAIYLLHQPLLQFYAAVFDGDPSGSLFYLQVMGATLLTIGVIGACTESQRHRLRHWLRRVLGGMTATRWWRGSVGAALAPRQGAQ